MSPGAELSIAFVVLYHHLNAFLMEFSEGEHCQPIVGSALHRGISSTCSAEAGWKIKEGYHLGMAASLLMKRWCFLFSGMTSASLAVM